MNPMDRKLEVPDYVILFKMVPLFSVVVVAIRRCPCVSQMPSGKNGKCLCLYLFTIQHMHTPCETDDELKRKTSNSNSFHNHQNSNVEREREICFRYYLQINYTKISPHVCAVTDRLLQALFAFLPIFPTHLSHSAWLKC